MCQGVVVSLISFKKKNKIVRVVLSGIGSHSDLVKDNLLKLKRDGWKENEIGERIVSIESDFSAWDSFTIENQDQPNRAELKILKTTYKKCAGSAKALIAHVKRCGKIDEALENLLEEDVRIKYEADRKPLYDKYEADRKLLYDKYLAERKLLYDKYLADRKPLDDKYLADRKLLYDKYEADRKPLDDKYLADWKLLYDKYLADRKLLYDKYEADRKLLYDKYEADRKPLYDKYEADRKLLDDKYLAERKLLWIKYFSVKANRVPHLQ